MTSKHYIVTRFNLRLWTEDKKGNMTQTEAWLKRRFELFETYCMSSVAKQTCLDFTWLVLFDEDVKENYSDKLQEYQQWCPQFTPVFIQRKYSRKYVACLREYIEKELKNEKEKGRNYQQVITTYLDNDDALSIDYVQRVQDCAQNLSYTTFVTFLYGIQYFEERNLATRVKAPANHFISLVEDLRYGEPVRTVYCYGGHSLIYKYRKVIPIYEIWNHGEEAWMEVVHENNVVNDFLKRRMHYVVSNQNLLKERYGIEQTLTHRWAFVDYGWLFVKFLKSVWRHVKKS